ncbi:hypothetical protein D3W54_10450 [Komagataeibacter medellinensis]|uniref:Uncharacterized protein n=1 Tax=Komagataeibacter medellinensis TaxID=1177712 RepID=A0ABQ6VWD9_9PROT|nr:hypothetical protein D3W54_10450 [Komagataeibacter medellinensis]
MCADQRGIDMNDFARRDPSLEKGLDGMLKDSPKPLDTLALANPHQRGIVGQRFVQAVSDTIGSRY